MRLRIVGGPHGPHRRVHLRLSLICTLLLAGGATPVARASYYSFSASPLDAPATSGNWMLTNYGGIPNMSGGGAAFSPGPGTIVLTGINDGSFVPGWTGLLIPAAGSGLFQFDYSFATLDDPHSEYAGYIVQGPGQTLLASQILLADTDGQSGSVFVSVTFGEVIGFYAGGDDQGGLPGILTVSNFSAPIPEPSGFQLMLAAAAAGAVVHLLRRKRLCHMLQRLLPAVVAAIFAVAGESQQLYYTATNVTGDLVLSGVVNLSQQASSYTVSQNLLLRDLAANERRRPSNRPFPEKLRVPPRLNAPAPVTSPLDTAVLRTMAVTPSTSALTITQPAGMSGFNALSQRDQRLANNGNQFSIEPPSPSVAAGNGYVLEGVNNAIQVYNASGTPALPAVLASNQLFGLAPAINRSTGAFGVYPTDMRVYFDQAMNRWFVMQWTQDNTSLGASLNSSHLYLAVSQTGDPTANYNIYIMNTTNPAHPGCPCLPDYPQFGADQYGLFITWNEYNASTYNFVDAVVLTLSKSSLGTGAVAPTAFQVVIPYVTGFEFSLRPAITPPGSANAVGTGGMEFFVSAYSGSALGSQIALWAMYNTSSLPTQNPSVTLMRALVPTLNYVTPGVAAQRPGPTPYGSGMIPPAALEYLEGGDTRVQSLSYAAGLLYLTLSTGLNDANGARVVGGAYMVVSATFRSGVLAGRVVNQGYLFVNGNHLLRPAIAVNAKGAGAIAVTLVGTTWYPSAALIPFAALSTPSTLQVAAAGALPEDGFTGYPADGGTGVARWGDYNTAFAASDGSIWMAVEYIGNYLRTDYANWNTYVIHTQP